MKNNDAAILNHAMMRNADTIRQWVQEEDVFIYVVDRGFRDSLQVLEDLGIKAQMPSFLKKGEKQLSTEDANSSRLVSKVSISETRMYINFIICCILCIIITVLKILRVFLIKYIMIMYGAYIYTRMKRSDQFTKYLILIFN